MNTLHAKSFSSLFLSNLIYLPLLFSWIILITISLFPLIHNIVPSILASVFLVIGLFIYGIFSQSRCGMVLVDDQIKFKFPILFIFKKCLIIGVDDIKDVSIGESKNAFEKFMSNIPVGGYYKILKERRSAGKITVRRTDDSKKVFSGSEVLFNQSDLKTFLGVLNERGIKLLYFNDGELRMVNRRRVTKR